MTTTKKKPTAKSTKATAARKKTTRSVSQPAFRSFQISKSTTPFLTFRLTKQSAYWLILSLVVLVLGIWVTILNVRIEQLLDQVELTNATSAYSVPAKSAVKPHTTTR
jgi:diacylglycerol kinase